MARAIVSRSFGLNRSNVKTYRRAVFGPTPGSFESAATALWIGAGNFRMRGF